MATPTPTTVEVKLQLRVDTAATWASVNPTLLNGEPGLESDTLKIKIGDGTTAWNSLAYFPFVAGGGIVNGNLEIGSTGTLTFEGSTVDGFETQLAVTDPTADRTITLPDQSGTVVVSGNASIVDADIAAGAEIAVSKLANGTANQVLVTDGTDVSWSDDLTLAGNLTVNGTTTTVNTETVLVKDKNIEMGVVDTPTDVTADGGGITLKGTTDKTINWIDSTDAWTSSERFSVPLGSAASPSLTFTGDENTGIYSPGADQLALSTGGTGRLFVDANGRILAGASSAVTPDGTNYPAFQINRPASSLLNASILIKETELSTSWPRLIINKNRANNVMQADNKLGSVDFYGDTGSSDVPGAVIQAAAETTWTSSSAPTRLEFRTTAAGATSSTEKLRITSAGLVGIGTSSPSKNLEVAAAGGPTLRFRNTTNYPTGSLNQPVGIIEFSSADGSLSDPRAVIAARFENDYGQSPYLDFQLRNGSNALSTALRIDSSGRVGIGTTSPSAQLAVSNGGAEGIELFPNESGATVLQSYNRSGAAWLEQRYRANVHRFDIGGANEKMRIDSSGRLLVGASSDSGGALLQVNGDRIRVATAKTPASATATGTAGEICWDASYIYVCTATNTWKRAALSTW